MRQHKDGSLIDISLTVSPVTDAEGAVIGASKIARDIRERKRAAEQQNMLIREMGHRVKNAFALMGGLVSLSARSAATPEALAQQLQARLAALTRAHDLTRPGLLESESTPGQSMTFHALVHAICTPSSRGGWMMCWTGRCGEQADHSTPAPSRLAVIYRTRSASSLPRHGNHKFLSTFASKNS